MEDAYQPNDRTSYDGEDAMTDDLPKRDQTSPDAGRQLAARVNAAYRKQQGLGYIHDANRREDERAMYEALRECGLLPQSWPSTPKYGVWENQHGQ